MARKTPSKPKKVAAKAKAKPKPAAKPRPKAPANPPKPPAPPPRYSKTDVIRIDSYLHDAERAQGGAQLARQMHDAAKAIELEKKRDTLLRLATELYLANPGSVWPECEFPRPGTEKPKESGDLKAENEDLRQRILNQEMRAIALGQEIRLKHLEEYARRAAGSPDFQDKVARAKNPHQAAFLSAFAQCGTVGKAAQMAQVSRRSHVNWMRDDADYPVLFGEAKAEACDRIEAEMARRGIEGVHKPVFHRGELCGVIVEYSDTLLAMLANGWMPEKYRLRARIDTNVTDARERRKDLAKLSDDELDQYNALLEKLEAES